ncbi:hypothetical protein [Acetobacter persici]|uniref:hypothetical protein n=1 Tax=Acetobacter persici TaxID=1076596 RepID=UPI001F157EEF|nr:hypothetical protein [Acetobacter persici]MCG0998139.1 hypothetical protein [Acetobacter persici]
MKNSRRKIQKTGRKTSKARLHLADPPPRRNGRAAAALLSEHGRHTPCRGWSARKPCPNVATHHD